MLLQILLVVAIVLWLGAFLSSRKSNPAGRVADATGATVGGILGIFRTILQLLVGILPIVVVVLIVLLVMRGCNHQL